MLFRSQPKMEALAGRLKFVVESTVNQNEEEEEERD